MDARELSKLEAALRPWIAVDTCFSGHPSDMLRFYEAVANAMYNKRKTIGYSNFRIAMALLVEENHTGIDSMCYEEEIENFALRAADIEGYTRRGR